MTIARLTAILACATALLSLSGCAGTSEIANRAIDFNAEAADAKSREIVLNVARASFGHPMQFTTITRMTGTSSGGAQIGIKLPFSLDGRPPIDVTGGATASQAPTFDLAILDTQEFMKGFMQPNSPDVVGYFLTQGFPKELIFRLFVEKVIVTKPSSVGGPKYRQEFRNDPAEPTAFTEILALLLAEGLDMESRTTVRHLLPVLSEAQAREAGPQIAMNQSGMALAPLDPTAAEDVAFAEANRIAPDAIANTWTLRREERSFVFCFSDPEPHRIESAARCRTVQPFQPAEPEEAAAGFPEARKVQLRARQYLREHPGLAYTALPQNGRAAEGTGGSGGQGTATAIADDRGNRLEIVLRSTERVMAYLGGTVRAERETGQAAKLGFTTGQPRLFDLRTPTGGEAVFAKVSYNGQSLAVPSETPEALSTQVIGILAQLIALNKSSKDLPLAIPITVVRS